MNAEQNDKWIKEQISLLEETPQGIVFSKEQAWQKLDQRLRPKTRSFKPLKWAVAAGLILTVLCSGFYIWKTDLKNELAYSAKKINSNVPSVIQQNGSDNRMIAATTHHLQPELYDTYSRRPQVNKKRKKQLQQAPAKVAKRKNIAGLMAYSEKLPACYLAGSEFSQPCFYP